MNFMPADWQLPPGVSRALWEYFHDPANARNYDESLAGTPLLSIDQDFVLEHCRPAGHLIDLGCGTGRLAITLGQRGYDVLAVDLSPEMLTVLREKSAAFGLDIPCVCANLVDLSALADRSFDHAACLFSTLGLIVGADARRRFLTHVHRLMKPGGVFVLHVHNRWFHLGTKHGRQLLWNNWMRGAGGDYDMPAHDGVGRLTMHLYTRHEIVGLLHSVGLEIIELRPVSLRSDGRLPCPWWFGSLRSYGYLIAAKKHKP